MSTLKKTIKKVIWHLRGGYKPQEFWDKWSKTFQDDPWQRTIHKQHAWMLQKVKNAKPRSILEVGCGFGRNIRFLIENGINPAIITGVDISPKMLQQAKKYINNSHVHLRIAKAEKLPFEDATFDMLIIHGVFMHISDKNISFALKECIRVAKRALIIVEQNYKVDNEYTFMHDYKTLCKNLHVSIEEYKNNKKLGLDYIYGKVR